MSSMRVDPFTMIRGWQKLTTRARRYKQASKYQSKNTLRTSDSGITLTLTKLRQKEYFYRPIFTTGLGQALLSSAIH